MAIRLVPGSTAVQARRARALAAFPAAEELAREGILPMPMVEAVCESASRLSAEDAERVIAHLDNLGPLRRRHHVMKTRYGWDLDADGGAWLTPAGAEIPIAAWRHVLGQLSGAKGRPLRRRQTPASARAGRPRATQPKHRGAAR